jgi:conjugal transfer pilus assembly protein TraK
VPSFASHARRAVLALACFTATPALAQRIEALPDQTSRIRLSNRDVNHIVCVGGEIEDARFSAEKGLAVERAGADAWVKFLVREVDDAGIITRTFVTTPTEIYVSCNGAIYPLYAEPAEIEAQTIILVPGTPQRARANEALLGPLVEEERAVSITIAMLQDRVPASFSEVAPNASRMTLTDLPGITLVERRRLEVEGAGLSVSEYLASAAAQAILDERAFLDRALGSDIFAVTIDQLNLAPGASARVIVVRRSQVQ